MKDGIDIKRFANRKCRKYGFSHFGIEKYYYYTLRNRIEIYVFIPPILLKIIDLFIGDLYLCPILSLMFM